MENQTNRQDLNADAIDTDQTASRKSARPKRKPSSRRAPKAKAAEAASVGKRVTKAIRSKAKPPRIGKTKKGQLIELLSKPGGAKLSVLVERLQWQSHTVRAALSGLRKQGFEISTSKSAKDGESVYSITTSPLTNEADKPGSAA